MFSVLASFLALTLAIPAIVLSLDLSELGLHEVGLST